MIALSWRDLALSLIIGAGALHMADRIAAGITAAQAGLLPQESRTAELFPLPTSQTGENHG